MQLSIPLILTIDGEEHHVRATLPEFIRFEKQFGKPIQAAFSDADNLPAEYIAFLAWAVAKRKGWTQADSWDADEFLDHLDDFGFGEDVEADPTKAALPTA